MNKIIITYIIFIFAFTGCVKKQPDAPPVPDIKISDLKPVNPDKIGNDLKTMNFDIVIFEVSTEYFFILEKIWSNLHTKPIDFANRFSLKNNAFKIGFGKIQIWDQIGHVLDMAQAAKYNQHRYLLTIENSENMPIKKLIKKTDIFYFNATLTPQTITGQKGRIIFNIKADKPIGTRGVCALTIKPELKQNKNTANPFEHLAFTSKMMPGDFLIIAPEKNYERKDSLGSFVFHRDFDQPKFLIYVIFCLGIND